jgi:colanic acid/amylovoran biosynthesis glycosyltransferase
VERFASSMKNTITKRITLCAYDTVDGKIGGPIAWAIDLIPYLRNSGFELEVLVLKAAPGAVGTIATACLAADVTVRVLDTGKTQFLDHQTQWILDQCRAFRPDKVIVNHVLPAIYAARYLRRAGIQSIAVMHSDPRHDAFYGDIVDVFISSREWHPDVAVSVSRTIRSLIGDQRNVAQAVIPCGCRATTRKAEFSGPPLKVLYCGRLVEFQKRIRDTTEAFLALTRNSDVRASICGAGDQAGWITNQIAGHSQLEFLGQIAPAHLAKVFSEHHVITLLSDFEGLPIALVEGMAHGMVPVGLASAPGVNEVIQHEKNGLLVQDRGESFRVAIERLRDPHYWKKLSVAAIETVHAEYSHEVTFAKWKDLLSADVKGTEISRIPSKVVLPDHGSRFVGYPQVAPSRTTVVKFWLRAAFQKLRSQLRPRARVRSLLKSRSPSKPRP